MIGRFGINCQFWRDVKALISSNFIAQADVLEVIFNWAQICLVFIAVFAYNDTKKYHFQKIYLLAELVHSFLTTRFLYVFTLSLGGSTEPPEPPLDPPQLSRTSIQVLLKFQLIGKRNSCAHLSKCSAVWCRAKEEIRARTAFFMLN